MKLIKILRGTALAGSLCIATFAQAATTPIQFSPNGTGATGAISVATFDWAPNSTLALNGSLKNGLVVGSKVVIVSQASLSSFLLAGGGLAIAPPGTEFTFVAGAGEVVDLCTGTPCSDARFVLDPTPALGTPNFFEMWVTTPPDSNNLAGTGFAGPPTLTGTNKRILFGSVNDATGNFALRTSAQGPAGTCPNGSVENLDQFGANEWPGQLTICGAGATKIEVQVISIDPDYFPGFTPTQLADLKMHFNTSTVVPYKQADPSRQFIGNHAGANGQGVQSVIVSTNSLGPVNGLPDGTTPRFRVPV